MSTLADETYTPTISASELAYRGAVWDIRRETFDLPEATGLVRDMMAHTGAVGIGVVDEENRILLIQQYRHPVRDRQCEVLQVLLDVYGETTFDASAGYLVEGVDLTAARMQVLRYSSLPPSNNSVTMRLYLAPHIRFVAVSDRHECSEE